MIQFSKFIAVGLINTAIDFGVLNLLMFATGAKEGAPLFVLNIISFSAATANSFLWNKYWTFKNKNSAKAAEIGQFLAISVVGALINSGAVFTIATFADPIFGFSQFVWVNIAKMTATGLSLIWNFLGYKFIVFKK